MFFQRTLDKGTPREAGLPLGPIEEPAGTRMLDPLEAPAGTKAEGHWERSKTHYKKADKKASDAQRQQQGKNR